MNPKEQDRAERSLLEVYDRIGRKKAAKACGVTVNATYKWTICPAAHVLTLEEVAAIPRSFLRPDLYPGRTVEK